MGLSQLTKAVQGINQLPDITSSAAPDLSQHIQDAKQFAGNWLSTRSSALSSAINGVTGLAGQWSSTWYHQLTQLADQQPPNASDIKSVLSQVSTEATSVKNAVDEEAKKTASDESQLLGIAAELNNDAALITAAIQGDESTIADLRLKIIDAQAKINAYHKREKWYWLLGPLGHWIASEIDKLASNISGYEDQVKAYSHTLEQLEADEQNLKVVIQSLSNATAAVDLLAKSVSSLNSGLGYVSGDLKDTIGEIDSIDQGQLTVWVKAQIETINKDITDTGAVASALNK